MRTPTPAITVPPLSRRAFLQTLGLACAARLRPLVARFTAIADDVVWLMRWCSYHPSPSLRLAGAG